MRFCDDRARETTTTDGSERAVKTDSKRTNRAANDVADRLRKLMAKIRPAIQQKHSLSNEATDVAITRGFGFVAVEVAKVIDLPLEVS